MSMILIYDLCAQQKIIHDITTPYSTPSNWGQEKKLNIAKDKEFNVKKLWVTL